MGIMTKFLEKNLKKEPVPVTGEVKALDENAYIQLARKAGFANVETVLRRGRAQARTLQFRAFLAENGITVYAEHAVQRYMRSVTPSGHHWSWLRVTGVYSDMSKSYQKPIPEAVLMVMAKIRVVYPEVQFDISDISRIPKPDPFLRASVDQEEWFIIERWDEPKFRM